jgi:hypothetical protein
MASQGQGGCRWYLSDIIGSGAEDDPFRVALADQKGVEYASAIETDNYGRPTGVIALCVVTKADHVALVADNRNTALPDAADGDTSKDVLDAVASAASVKGMSVSATAGAKSFGAALRKIATTLGWQTERIDWLMSNK